MLEPSGRLRGEGDEGEGEKRAIKRRICMAPLSCSSFRDILVSIKRVFRASRVNRRARARSSVLRFLLARNDKFDPIEARLPSKLRLFAARISVRYSSSLSNNNFVD